MCVLLNCMCVCVFSSHLFWKSGVWTYQSGAHIFCFAEECRKGFLIPLPSEVLALIFLARRIQLFLSLVDRDVIFCGLTIRSSPIGHLKKENLSYRDSNSRPNVSKIYEITNLTTKATGSII